MIDYLRDPEEIYRRSFATVLQYMERYSAVPLRGLATPAIRIRQGALPAALREDQDKKAVKAGRWEAQGGMWVEPDGNVPSGESFVRQLLYGTRFFEKELGAKVNHLWMPD